LLALGFVFDLGGCGGLPLHVAGVVCATGAQGDDVVDYMAWAAAFAWLLCWAWVGDSKGTAGFLASLGRWVCGCWLGLD
jgi:hypothetical protein